MRTSRLIIEGWGEQSGYARTRASNEDGLSIYGGKGGADIECQETLGFPTLTFVGFRKMKGMISVIIMENSSTMWHMSVSYDRGEWY